MAAGDSLAGYAALEDAIAAWARGDEAVRAVLVVGSRARTTHAADEWSDLDLIVFTSDVPRFAASAGWLARIGEPWLVVPGRTGRGDPEWQALFPGGLKADFVFAAAPDLASPLAALLHDSPYGFVYERGLRVLFDRHDPKGAEPVPIVTPAPLQRPSADEYAHLCGEFLIAWMRSARFALRGDIWRAKAVCDGTLKAQLLTMLEWHALATREPPPDVWHDGRFMAEWADPPALADLPDTFARYDAADLQRALAATHRLFHRLAREAASRWNYAYPDAADRAAAAWVRDAFETTAQ